jgi:hypothetical protein
MIQTYTCRNCGYFWVFGEGTGTGEDDPLPGDFTADTCSQCRPDLDAHRDGSDGAE